MPFKLNLPNEEIVDMYTNEFMTAEKIATKFNVSRWSVLRRLEIEGVSRRSRSHSRRMQIGEGDKYSLAYLFGVLKGDGYISPNYSFVLNAVDKDFVSYVKLKLDKYGESKLSMCVDKRENCKDIYRVQLHRRNFVELFNKMEFNELDFIQKVQFINGFYDAEGCVHVGKNMKVLTLGNQNKLLLSEISSFMNDLGIVNYLREHTKDSGNYVLSITKYDAIARFQTIFRFSIKRKQKKLDDIIRRGKA